MVTPDPEDLGQDGPNSWTMPSTRRRGEPGRPCALDRKELHELGLELDNPEGFADE